jgi:carboxypeptidase family protein
MKPSRAAAIVILGVAASTLAAAADTYPVTGIVIDSVTRQSIPGARVSLLRATRPDPSVSVTTGADGRFAFDAAEGQYRLGVEFHRLSQFFGETLPGAGFSTGVLTGPGLETTNLVFLWNGPSAISGKVLDDAGDPVEGALVQLLQSTVSQGRRTVRTVGNRYTNDLGEYRFGPLNRGTYYLAVSGHPWYAATIGALTAIEGRPMPGPGASAENTPAFAPIYYPAARDASRAGPLVLISGKESSADFVLSPVPGVNVRVECDCPDSTSKTLTLFSEGVLGSERVQYLAAMPTKVMNVAGVPPGHYTARILGGDGQFLSYREFDVAAADVSVRLSVRPPAKVLGTVRFKSTPAGARRPILVRLVREDTQAQAAAAVQPDGSFEFAGLIKGRYLPRLASADGYFAEEITSEGAALKDGAIELTDGALIQLGILASDETGDLKGHVVQNDRPVPSVQVLLVPRAPKPGGVQAMAYQTDSDGSFIWAHVPAGDYCLFAVDYPEIEYANPYATQKYCENALSVHIDAHRAFSERLPLMTRN